ncbi:hypothetical protein EAI_08476 [Harpegnathos saltator]|uniref:Uncharacterized protein n=1 Tax=Harpegnathos saltator TaxID=610380 RepID=E2BJL5_HARSA|nr:hypothetical protein EAI_08476 [Harpegnathos saltator]
MSDVEVDATQTNYYIPECDECFEEPYKMSDVKMNVAQTNYYMPECDECFEGPYKMERRNIPESYRATRIPEPCHATRILRRSDISLPNMSKNDCFIKAVPTFVDLQGFIIRKRFIVKEAAILRNGTILSHYISTSPMPWEFLTRSEKSRACWVTDNHHGLRWGDGTVKYCKAK